MSLLEPILRPFGSLLNRRIRANSEALSLCAELAGREIAVRVSNSAIAAGIVIQPDGVQLTDVIAAEPDLLLEGSLLSLARLAGSDPLAAIREGHVELSGDANLAQSVQKLMALAKPDLEDDVAAVLGDSAGRVVAETVRTVRNFGAQRLRGAAKGAGTRFAAGQSLPGTEEFEDFSADVRAARDQAERLSARLNVLRAKRADEDN